MRRAIGITLAVIVAVGLNVGPGVAPVQSANLLCPQLCLSGGLLSGVGLSASGVSGPGIASTGESRTYRYNWTIVDLTDEVPAVANVPITINVTGSTSGAVFNGSGTAKLGAGPTVPIQLTDSGGVVNARGTSGDTFALNAVGPAGGVGQATYSSSSDYSFGGGNGGDGKDCVDQGNQKCQGDQDGHQNPNNPNG